MQFQKEVYWSECNRAENPGRACEASSLCRAQYPHPHPSEDQHNCLVEYVVYVVSTTYSSVLSPSAGVGGSDGDAGLHMRRGCRHICCVNIHNSAHMRTHMHRCCRRQEGDCRIEAGYYQSDRHVESGRSKLSTGGEALRWWLPWCYPDTPTGPWLLPGVAWLCRSTLGAGWAQRWPKAYLTTGHVKPVSEPDSDDHIRRHQALAGVRLRVWTPSNFRSCWIRILASNSQAAMPRLPRKVRSLRRETPCAWRAWLNDKPLTNGRCQAPARTSDESDSREGDMGKQGNQGTSLFFFFSLFTPSYSTASQRVCQPLGTAKCSVTESPASSVSRSAHMQPPHRTAPHHTTLHSCSLAVFCPGPQASNPAPFLPSRMPDAIAMPSGVPLGCCPSRSLPWKARQLSPKHSCAVTTVSTPQSASSIASLASPAFQTKLPASQVPACLHAPRPACIAFPPSASFHISPGHR